MAKKQMSTDEEWIRDVSAEYVLRTFRAFPIQDSKKAAELTFRLVEMLKRRPRTKPVEAVDELIFLGVLKS